MSTEKLETELLNFFANEKKSLDIIKRPGEFTVSEYMQSVGCSIDVAYRRLKKLVKEGKLLSRKTNLGFYFHIVKEE